MTRLGLVVDSAAELTQDALADPGLTVLPAIINIDGVEHLDGKLPSFTREFNHKYLNVKSAAGAHSSAMSVDDMTRFFVERLATRFDHVFGLFVLSSRSPLFKNASDAASRVIGESVGPRAAAGQKGPMFLEAHDSMNMADGYAVQVQEMQRLIASGESPASIRSKMDALARQSYCYVVPSQLDFIATRAKVRGDQSAGAFSIAAAKLLGVIPVVLAHQGATNPVLRVRGVDKARDHVIALARREIARGLSAPFVSASFSGDPALIEAMPAWQLLQADARRAQIGVSLKQMSPTSAINLGPDALCMGFIASPHAPEL